MDEMLSIGHSVSAVNFHCLVETPSDLPMGSARGMVWNTPPLVFGQLLSFTTRRTYRENLLP